ncbi:MAG: DUF3047 domain-containing protein [Acidobacteriota bacterium]
MTGSLNLRLVVSLSVLFAAFFLAGSFARSLAPSPHEWVTREYEEYLRLHTNEDGETVLQAWLQGLGATEGLAERVLSKQWVDMKGIDRRRFVQALGNSLRDGLARKLSEIDSRGAPRMELREARPQAGGAQLTYELSGDRASFTVTLSLAFRERGWELVDLLWKGGGLLRYYRDLSRNALRRYSMPVLVEELAGEGFIVLEDFEDNEVGAFPDDWDWRGWGKVEDKPYRVVEESGNRFLRAEDTGENVVLTKAFRWNIKKYPYVSWRWRIRAVPGGGDERHEELADSAAGIYLTYRKKLWLLPEMIKFVWSSKLPVGSAFRRSGMGMPWTVVAGSGRPRPSEWRTFVFNAFESYRETFGGDPGERPLGMGILSDANDTGGKAFADYDDIIIMRHAPSPARIREILTLEQGKKSESR